MLKNFRIETRKKIKQLNDIFNLLISLKFYLYILTTHSRE